MGKIRIDLTNKEFDNWIALKYTEKGKWLCRCKLCNTEREISGYFLNKGQIPKCSCETGRSSKGLIDLTDMEFGEWKVLEYAGDKKWVCQCSCGTKQIIPGCDLRNKKTTKCKNHISNSMVDKTFGEWKVNKILENGMCECTCSCGVTKQVSINSILTGASKSCGHDTTKLIEITDQTFGYLKVIERLDSLGNYKCLCTACNNYYITTGYRLRHGLVKSCGCMSNEIRKETCKIKYGVSYSSQINTCRTADELEYINNNEKLESLIDRIKQETGTVTIYDLTLYLNIDRGSVYSLLQRRELLDKVDLYDNTSHYERQLIHLFGGTSHNREILDGQEIDIWCENKQLGIEFNGNYWHSEEHKDYNYHKNKTILALEKNIRLIHIFEYEWNNEVYRSKLISYINSIIHEEQNKILNARKCSIVKVDKNTSDTFLNSNHLQGSSNSQIQLGLQYENEIVGIMTFGKPRFNNKFEYELIRLAFKSGVIINGGSEKLFKYFIVNYNPQSIVSYCNMSKFTGKVYEKLGFREDGWTDPGYVWWKGTEILNRYNTQKEKLVKQGLGEITESESEIMYRLGYKRIYDSGNKRFVWEA